MNKQTILPVLAIVLFPLAALPAGTITTEFENVEDYTDLSVSGMSEEKSLPLFKAEMDEELEASAEKYLQDGQTLALTFTDVDMAGDIQPWRNRYNADIRYVEAIYPPRLKFRYTLTDADGKVLEEGAESISDLAFQMNVTASIRQNFRNFHYETDLMKDWIRKMFRKKD
ncbi:MAG: DUF3016 domain-containing protein [Oceanipulchritudo sp.]